MRDVCNTLRVAGGPLGGFFVLSEHPHMSWLQEGVCVALLCQTLLTTHITYLDLGNCNLNDQGMLSVMPLLPRLSHLCVEKTFVGDASASLVAAFVRQDGRLLEHVSFQGCTQLTVAALDTFASSLGRLRTLLLPPVDPVPAAWSRALQLNGRLLLAQPVPGELWNILARNADAYGACCKASLYVMWLAKQQETAQFLPFPALWRLIAQHVYATQGDFVWVRE